MSTLIDLHIHSTASDGIHPPSEVIRIAHRAGLTSVALADHDSTAGIDEAMSTGQSLGVQVIPAVELSVAYQGYHDVHLLGYWINHHDGEFCTRLELFREKRESRGLRIIERINDKLASEGKTAITSDEVLALADGALGRPHIARVLINHGHVQSMQEAFADYLLPCNVPKEYFDFDDALGEIKRIGGVAILAHPQSITRNRSELTAIITEMAARGLDGIEALNTMGLEDDDSFLRSLAKSLDLLITGGSDFHGGEEGLTMGRGRGNLYLTTDLLTDIATRLEARKNKSPAQ
jgi:predicted metal-dependent phosphoesterase TrpH